MAGLDTMAERRSVIFQGDLIKNGNHLNKALLKQYEVKGGPAIVFFKPAK
jgi:thiol:disulfide interchange protein